jgi:hypothetical protein
MLASYLKEALEDVQHSPLLALSLFQRFSSLVHRPYIQGKMEPIIEKMSISLQGLVQAMSEEEDSDYHECISGQRSFIEAILRSRQRNLKARHWMEASNARGLMYYFFTLIIGTLFTPPCAFQYSLPMLCTDDGSSSQ